MDGFTTAGEQLPERFRGRREAGRALAGVARGWLVFLQIAAPWALALAVWLDLLEMIDPTKKGPVLQAFAGGFGIASFIVAVMLSTGTVAVAWHRWVIQGRRPRLSLAVPDWPAVVYTSLFWWFGIVIVLVVFVAGYLVDAILGLVTGRAIAFAVAAVVMVMVAIPLSRSSSRGALGLPALAVGDPRFPPERPRDDLGRRRGKGAGPGETASAERGAGLHALPRRGRGALLVDVIYLAKAPPRGRFDLLDVGIMTVCLLLVFAATAAAAGCLSSAYLAAKLVMIDP